MKDLITTAAIFCAAVQLPAQQVRVIKLGMTAAQVRAVAGSPSGYFANRKLYKTVPLRVWTPIYDVYERRVKGRLYEVKIGYAPDETASRLHPLLRVSEVRFEADRPDTVSRLLSDFAEARAACSVGCGVEADHFSPTTVLDVVPVDGNIVVQADNFDMLTTEMKSVGSLDDVATDLTLLPASLLATGEEYRHATRVGEWKP